MEPIADAKQKYSDLKKRLRHLLSENETYKQEILKVNDRLLRVNKDKAFLLEQLLNYEDNDSSTESELSESDQDLTRTVQPEPPKKKPRQRKPKVPNPDGSPAQPKVRQSLAEQQVAGTSPLNPKPVPRKSPSIVPKKPRAPAFKAKPEAGQSVDSVRFDRASTTLTAKEVERQLLAKQSPRIQMPPQLTSLTLPAELFNEEAFFDESESFIDN